MSKFVTSVPEEVFVCTYIYCSLSFILRCLKLRPMYAALHMNEMGDINLAFKTHQTRWYCG